MTTRAHFPRAGAVLIEVMLAVAIFALAVLALGRSVENCMAAQISKEETERARLFLENRMTEIEASAVAIANETQTEELKGGFSGMTLKTSRVQLKRKNEKEQDLFGLYQVDLELIWKSSGQQQSRALTFYHYPRQR